MSPSSERGISSIGGVSAATIIESYPTLYHMAEEGSWDSIRRHGLLSTSALLDLFEISGAERRAIEHRHRPECVAIEHPAHGRAVIRDQKPMDDVGLTRALRDGITPAEWYALLNGHVFFWLTKERLKRLLGARAYRTKKQTILEVNTARLLARYGPKVVLSPCNTGATKPMPHPRGADCFLPLANYPYANWVRRRRGRDPIVELAIPYGIPDIVDFLERVTLIGNELPEKRLWSRT